MRRVLAAILLLLLVTPDSSAQVPAPARITPTQADIAAQAAFDTSTLLALYMAQLAASGTPPTQADIDQAAQKYFTNGAAVMGVPRSGPGAAYFTNGAAVTGVPSSGPGAAYFHNGAAVMAYPAPVVTPAPSATPQSRPAPVEGQPPLAAQPAAMGTAATPATATAPSAAPSRAQLAAMTGAGSSCPLYALEAAMAIGREFATSAEPTPTSSPPSTAANPVSSRAEAPSQPVAGPAPTSLAEPSPSCPSAPSVLSHLGAVLGGFLLGGLAVALWARPRSLRLGKV